MASPENPVRGVTSPPDNPPTRVSDPLPLDPLRPAFHPGPDQGCHPGPFDLPNYNFYIMQATSIHLRPCKISSSEIHNKREKKLDYVVEQFSHKNEWWSSVDSLWSRRTEIAALVKAKTGRKMQAKAVPFREGVVVIKEDTTMDELQELARRFKDAFGVEAVQIAIHRDEGHWVASEKFKGFDTAEFKPNHHAHIVFDWYNHETGKSIRTTKADAAKMQTICAEVLGMERGVVSEKKHVDAKRYKAQQVEKRLKESEEQLSRTEEALSTAHQMLKDTCECIEVAQSLGNSLIDRLTGKTSQKRKEGVITLAEAQKRAHDAEEQLKAEKERADNVIAEWGAWKKENQKELDNVGNLKKENQTLKEQNEFAKRELETFKDGMAKRMDNFMRLHEEGHTIGLSPEQCNRLWQMPRNQDLEIEQLYVDGEAVSNPAPKQDKWKVRLTFGDNLRIMLGTKWQLVSEWLSNMRKRLQKKAEELSVNTRKRGMGL